MKIKVISTVLLLVVASGSSLGQGSQNPLGAGEIPERLSVPSNSVCGVLELAATGRPVTSLRLELTPVTYRFHQSMVQIRVGKTVKESRSGQDGKFDPSGVKPGEYMLRIASSADGAWGELNILPQSGRSGCALRLRLDTEQNTVALSQQ